MERGRALDVHLLDGNENGISQITETLVDYQDLDAIHLVSHATADSVKLGDLWLGADNVHAHADALTAWSSSVNTRGRLVDLWL